MASELPTYTVVWISNDYREAHKIEYLNGRTALITYLESYLTRDELAHARQLPKFEQPHWMAEAIRQKGRYEDYCLKDLLVYHRRTLLARYPQVLREC